MNIRELSEQAGLAFASDSYPDIWQIYMVAGKEEIERFAELVAAHEREQCAKVCDDWNTALTDKLADAIRARGKA
jgi:hypothetical protein